MAPKPIDLRDGQSRSGDRLPDAVQARPDAIVATGRSDFPNQVNNVLGFPFIFRGALDVRARAINEEMKLAAARALAELAREDVPDEVAERLRRARAALRPRLHHPEAVRHARALLGRAGRRGGGDGVGVGAAALDIDDYRDRLERRAGGTQSDHEPRRAAREDAPKRIVFPEGDNDKILRACQIVLDERHRAPDPARVAKRSASAPASWIWIWKASRS